MLVSEVCLRDLGLKKQNTLDKAASTADISYSSGVWEVQDQGAGRAGV